MRPQAPAKHRRRRPRVPPEHRGQPALRHEAALQRDRRQRPRRLEQQATGTLHPPRLHEHPRRRPRGHPERPREVGRAEARPSRQRARRQLPVQVGLDEYLDARQRGRREPSPRVRPRPPPGLRQPPADPRGLRFREPACRVEEGMNPRQLIDGARRQDAVRRLSDRIIPGTATAGRRRRRGCQSPASAGQRRSS